MSPSGKATATSTATSASWRATLRRGRSKMPRARSCTRWSREGAMRTPRTTIVTERGTRKTATVMTTTKMARETKKTTTTTTTMVTAAMAKTGWCGTSTVTWTRPGSWSGTSRASARPRRASSSRARATPSMCSRAGTLGPTGRGSSCQNSCRGWVASAPTRQTTPRSTASRPTASRAATTRQRRGSTAGRRPASRGVSRTSSSRTRSPCSSCATATCLCGPATVATRGSPSPASKRSHGTVPGRHTPGRARRSHCPLWWARPSCGSALTTATRGSTKAAITPR
mmetsp:Transcript_493/g.1274  ORF Transcript_493/g.1274 Transcript_493/m.1274 type:complete len:284 (+) Transcript_493:1698-2549(+)